MWKRRWHERPGSWYRRFSGTRRVGRGRAAWTSTAQDWTDAREEVRASDGRRVPLAVRLWLLALALGALAWAGPRAAAPEAVRTWTLVCDRGPAMHLPHAAGAEASRLEVAVARAEAWLEAHASGEARRYVSATPEGLEFADEARHGSFLVVRSFHVDVAGLRAWASEQSRATRIAPERLSAMLMGRWRDGTPVAHSPDVGLGLHTPSNDFDLHAGTASAARCPMSSHVRRANPRDARPIEEQPRILRRSVVKHDTDELLFMCYQASIDTQFEHIYVHWMHRPLEGGPEDELDALMGVGPPGGRAIVVDPALGTRVHTSARFVAPRAGGYFFVPSRTELGRIATPPTLQDQGS